MSSSSHLQPQPRPLVSSVVCGVLQEPPDTLYRNPQILSILCQCEHASRVIPTTSGHVGGGEPAEAADPPGQCQQAAALELPGLPLRPGAGAKEGLSGWWSCCEGAGGESADAEPPQLHVWWGTLETAGGRQEHS